MNLIESLKEYYLQAGEILSKIEKDVYSDNDTMNNNLIALGRKLHMMNSTIRSQISYEGNEKYQNLIQAENEVNKISLLIFKLNGKKCYKVVFPKMFKSKKNLICVNESWENCYRSIIDNNRENITLIDNPILIFEHEYDSENYNSYSMKDVDNYDKHFIINLLEYSLITDDRNASLIEYNVVRNETKTNIYIIPKGSLVDFQAYFEYQFREPFF